MSDVIVFDTKSRKDLLRWMRKDPKSRTRAAIARALGLTQPAVSGWVLGRTRPDPSHRLAVAVLTGGEVAAEGWALADEKKLVAETKPFRSTGTEG